MADEPTGNLDSVNGTLVLDLLISLNQREGTTLVLVTHDRTLAARADRIVTLSDGKVVADEMQRLGEWRAHESVLSHRLEESPGAKRARR